MYRSFALVATLCVVFSLLVTSNAFTFDLPLNKERCFVEEVASDTSVKISYVATDAYAQFVDVVLNDFQGNNVWSRIGMATGTHSFRVVEGGEYTLCFISRAATSSRGLSEQKRAIVLNFKVGTESIDYKDLATKEKLKPIELQLRMVEEAIQTIHSEYDYYKKKEAEMRNTNEHMTAKVTYVSLGLIAIFVLFSAWQIRHLRSYFRKKRMID